MRDNMKITLTFTNQSQWQQKLSGYKANANKPLELLARRENFGAEWPGNIKKMLNLP